MFIPNEQIPGQDSKAAEVFEKLMIEGEYINMFYAAFADMDADFCGFIRIDEMREYFKIADTAMNNKVFGLFRSFQRGHYNFMEFVCVIWNFLSRDKDSFPALVFSSYCDPEKQTLDANQLDRLVAAIHGESYKQKSSQGLREVVQKFVKVINKTNPPSPLNINEFNALVRDHPIMIGPLLKLRFSMCTELIGEGYWLYLARQRLASQEMADNNYILKITGNDVSAQSVKEDEITRSAGKPVRRKSVIDTMQDVLRGRHGQVDPSATPSLVAPTSKRKRKSVFKPNLTVPGASETGVYRITYAKNYETKVSAK